jgi:HAD superfamily hydrolase (TIGR01509 family)
VGTKGTYWTQIIDDSEFLGMIEDKLKVKGILFDLDGTILDTRDAYIEAARIAFNFLGQEPPENATCLELPKRLEQKQPFFDLVKADRKQFLDVYLKSFYSLASSKTRPFPNVADALELLSAKAKFALITMRFFPKEAVAAELKQFSLDSYFPHVVTGLDTPKPKPSPDGLFKAVEALGVQTSECVIVGDSIIDVQAGIAAGVKTVAVLSGLYSFEELSKAKPNFIIKDVSELPNIVE